MIFRRRPLTAHRLGVRSALRWNLLTGCLGGKRQNAEPESRMSPARWHGSGTRRLRPIALTGPRSSHGFRECLCRGASISSGLSSRDNGGGSHPGNAGPEDEGYCGYFRSYLYELATMTKPAWMPRRGEQVRKVRKRWSSPPVSSKWSPPPTRVAALHRSAETWGWPTRRAGPAGPCRRRRPVPRGCARCRRAG